MRETGWRPTPWMLAGSLLLGGCAVDLLVGGEPSGTTGTVATDEGGTTTVEPATTEPVGDSSTGELDPDTSTGEVPEGTTTTGEENTSTGEMAEGTTTGEISCEGLSFGDCNELPFCLWYGEPKAGECALSPCEMPMHDCLEIGFKECVDAPPCAWVGEPEMGECGPLECVPCEVLDEVECNETPTCFIDEMEMACVPVR